MYWERSSRPCAAPILFWGSQRASTVRLSFLPGTTQMFLAVAWPISVPLLKSLMFTYGTMAEYSVGFVILTLT